MALIKCKECGEEISDKATRCVHCNKTIEDCIHHFCPECKEEYDNTLCKNCGYSPNNKKDTTNRSANVSFNFIPLLKSLGITGLFTILFSLQPGGLDTIGCFCLFILFFVGCLVFSGCDDIFDELEDFHASTDKDPYKRALYKEIKKNNKK